MPTMGSIFLPEWADCDRLIRAFVRDPYSLESHFGSKVNPAQTDRFSQRCARDVNGVASGEPDSMQPLRVITSITLAGILVDNEKKFARCDVSSRQPFG